LVLAGFQPSPFRPSPVLATSLSSIEGCNRPSASKAFSVHSRAIFKNPSRNSSISASAAHMRQSAAHRRYSSAVIMSYPSLKDFAHAQLTNHVRQLNELRCSEVVSIDLFEIYDAAARSPSPSSARHTYSRSLSARHDARGAIGFRWPCAGQADAAPAMALMTAAWTWAREMSQKRNR
jgi:hypothetical protein